MSNSMLPMLKNNPRSHLHHPFPMDMWDTFKEFHDHHQAILAQHANAAALFGGAAVEWNETPEAHVLAIELPGLGKEEVKVKVKEGRFLKISGKKRVDKEEKHENWHHVERRRGKFSRVFTLPENSRADRVKSHFENATLVVTVPKRDVVRKRHGARDLEVMG